MGWAWIRYGLGLDPLWAGPGSVTPPVY